MAVESEIIIEFIYDMLTTDASLSSETDITKRVVEGVAPQETIEPFISVQGQDYFDVMGMGARRIMVDDEYLIRAIDQSESFNSTLTKFARRIDTALHDVSGTTNSGTVFSLTRQREFRLTEIDDQGVMHKHLGGFYRVLAQ